MECFWNTDGSYAEGLIFSEEDFCRLNEISKIDVRVICINGYYMPFAEENSDNAVVNTILYFYEKGRNLLKDDFLECFVVNTEKATVCDSRTGEYSVEETKSYIYNGGVK